MHGFAWHTWGCPGRHYRYILYFLVAFSYLMSCIRDLFSPGEFFFHVKLWSSCIHGASCISNECNLKSLISIAPPADAQEEKWIISLRFPVTYADTYVSESCSVVTRTTFIHQFICIPVKSRLVLLGWNNNQKIFLSGYDDEENSREAYAIHVRKSKMVSESACCMSEMRGIWGENKDLTQRYYTRLKTNE